MRVGWVHAMRIPGRLATFLSIGALGLAPIVAAGCASGGGSQSTTDVCRAVDARFVTANQGLTSLAPVLANPTAPAGGQQQALDTLKSAYGDLAAFLRSEAGQASDKGLAAALRDMADAIDSGVAKMSSLADVREEGAGARAAEPEVRSFCPDFGSVGG